MKFLRNRTIIGIVCIAVSLLICFGLTPLWNAGLGKTIEVIQAAADIRIGQQITENMVRKVVVGKHNLNSQVVKSKENVIGRYAAYDMVEGEYIMISKLSETATGQNEYLNTLDGKKRAVSVTVDSLAAGVSSKLQSGDIVSVIVPSEVEDIAHIPPELQYVEVISVTADSGYDTDEKREERELAETVTLLATEEQSQILVNLESQNKIYFALVYRGNKDKAAEFIEKQDKALENIRIAKNGVLNGD